MYSIKIIYQLTQKLTFMKTHNLFFYLSLALCLFINVNNAFSQKNEIFSGESKILLDFSKIFYGDRLYFEQEIVGTETYEYQTKDNLKVKNGKYKFESVYYSRGEEDKQRFQLRITVEGKFADDKPDSIWNEKLIGLENGYPIKCVSRFSFVNGSPQGLWSVCDTMKRADGIKYSNSFCTIKENNIIGSYSYNSNWSGYNISKDIPFDENGLLNDGNMFFHGWRSIYDIDDYGPEWGLTYNERQDNIYKFETRTINLLFKTRFLPDFWDEQHEIFYSEYLNDFCTYHPTYSITLSEFPDFIIGYSLDEVTLKTMKQFIEKNKGTTNENLSMAYYTLWEAIDLFNKNDYYATKDKLVAAQTYCKDCKIKDVINRKLTKVKSLIFE